MTTKTLEPREILHEVDGLTLAQLDALPFGAIQLDQLGTVLLYNSAEERIAGRRREEVVGAELLRRRRFL